MSTPSPHAPPAPFAPRRVSLRLYPHNELSAGGVVRELCDQAGLGIAHGFDGIMTSEHHGGVGGYFPNPMQLTSFILDENAVGWAAACPMLLPLRPTAQVAEETAWLAARHPGRVGLGVAAGAMELDFTSMGLDVADSVPRFKAELPRIVAMLRGEDLRGLDEDRALKECGIAPVPVLSAAVSVAAARRSARVGAGVLFEGMSSPERLADLCRAYRDEGGSESAVVIRRVWLGDELADLVEQQRSFYASIGRSGQPFGVDQTIAGTDPAEMADRLAVLMADTAADHLNLRVHLPGVPAEAIREQIVRLGDEVLPRLNALLAAAA